MSTRNANRAALASATALVGADASPNTAPVVSVPQSDAAPLPSANATPHASDNIAKPSKRALDNARAGIDGAMQGEDTSEAGRGMIAAAIVDYALNSLKWKPADAIKRGQLDARVRGNELSEFRASCVHLFIGAKPSVNRKDTLAVQYATQRDIALWERKQYHVNYAANLSLCLIADGCTMRDYDASSNMWNLRGSLYCEEGVVPCDTKARYTMQRVYGNEGAIKCNGPQNADGVSAEAHMPRDRAHYVDVASLRHAILQHSQVSIDKRAPHRNASPATPAATPAQTPARGGYNAGNVVTPAAPNAAPNATPPVGNAPTNNTSQPVSAPTTTAHVTAPADSDTKASFAGNVIATRRSMLALCEAPTVQAINPARLMMIGPRTMPTDAFNAWLDVCKMVNAWQALQGATPVATETNKPAPVVHTEPTIVAGVVLSTPVKADKIEAAATDATSDAPIAAEVDAPAPKRAAKSRTRRAA